MSGLQASNAVAKWEPKFEGLPNGWYVRSVYVDMDLTPWRGSHVSAQVELIHPHKHGHLSEMRVVVCELTAPPSEWLYPALRFVAGLTHYPMTAEMRGCQCYW